MSIVFYTGLKDPLFKQVALAMPDVDLMPVNNNDLSEAKLGEADAIILGPETGESIRVAQKIGGLDAYISVIILASADELSQTKNDLRFTPFISQNTYCFTFSLSLIPELKKVTEQTAQRRRFHRIQSSITIDRTPKPVVLRIEQLGNFLEQAPIGAVLLDGARQVVALNQKARTLFNWTSLPEKKLPQLDDLIPDQEAKRIISLLKEPAGIKNHELEIQNKFLELNVSEVISDIGDSYKILLINDITERKIEDKRVRTMLNVLPQMGWLTDNNGGVTYLTEGWYNYTGQSRNAPADEWLDYIFIDDRAKVIEKWRECLPTGKLFEQEARYKKHTGEYRWHLVRAVPVLNAEYQIDYWLGIATDIEDQKRIEKGLEEEVKMRTNELSEANDLLQKSNADLGEFAHIASHDLQEPLRKIRTFSNLMEMDLKNEPKVRDYLGKINSSIDRMSELIKGILSHSSLSGSSGDLTDVDLQQILDDVSTDFELLLSQKKASIKSGPLPVIKASKLQMQQLFSNLISNSLKYSEQAPVITIQSKVITDHRAFNNTALAPKTFLELTFADNGIGFDQQNAKKIFDIFKRLHDKKLYAGTGIGLALCKKIVENHNGYIFASSEPGSGAKFYVYLPIA